MKLPEIQAKYRFAVMQIILQIEKEHGKFLGWCGKRFGETADFENGSFDFSDIKQGQYPSYDKALELYLDKFTERTAMDFFAWDVYGSVAVCGDYHLNFTDIAYFVDNRIPLYSLIAWYEGAMWNKKQGKTVINFQNYCRWIAK